MKYKAGLNPVSQYPWRCHKCGTHNQAGRGKCTGCGFKPDLYGKGQIEQIVDKAVATNQLKNMFNKDFWLGFWRWKNQINRIRQQQTLRDYRQRSGFCAGCHRPLAEEQELVSDDRGRDLCTQCPKGAQIKREHPDRIKNQFGTLSKQPTMTQRIMDMWGGGQPGSAPTSPTPTTASQKDAIDLLDPFQLHPLFLAGFDDEDDLFNLLESLGEQELSIINEHKDNPDELVKIKIRIRNDLDDSAKQLSMED